MATTIKPTDLDFARIKNQLKTHLQSKTEFKDYNFEASGLSNVLDVLAYGIHYDALIANFALNETYLNTAQLRSSLISIAESMGYVPGSRTAAAAAVNISVDLSSLASQPATIELPIGTQFTSEVDDVLFTFSTRETLFASNNGGVYEFETSEGSSNVLIHEGTEKSKRFIVGSADNEVYVIPDNNLDINTVTVRVYESLSSSEFEEYTNIFSATELTENSALYNIKESPNEYFELNFGDGNALGKLPSPGNVIEVTYLSVFGPDANTAAVFTPVSEYVYDGDDYTLAVATVSSAAGGSNKESIESIRRNVPFRYAAQNRMVTATDYSSLILREYGSSIRDIISWGGEDNTFPEFGVTFISVLFNDDVSAEAQDTIKTGIESLVSQFAVITFDIRFSDPEITYLELNTTFRFDPNLTTSTLESTEDNVRTAIVEYMTEETNRFSGAFRRSNLLSKIDDVSNSVLSSAVDVTMNKLYIPSLTALNTFTITFPTVIDDVITSSPFIYNGNRCVVQSNVTNGTLQVIRTTDGVVLIDNVGEYDTAAGTLSIIGLEVDAFVEGSTALTFRVKPSNAAQIVPSANVILQYDTERSRVTGELRNG